ncbi:MAG: SufD family Fe-S cluster assembly protein, partial [Actinomycetia bacterium]|nr:SufD family Fe-S cluster assembly protein [Actinomycetes bacterium]
MPDVAARIAEIRALAEAARDKKAAYGPDLDLTAFNAAHDSTSIDSLEALERQVKEVALAVGIDTSETDRSGSYFQIDRSPIYQRVTEMYGGKLEIMSTADAVKLYPEIMFEKYYWRAMAPDKDKYTAQVALQQTEGYFIRVLPGQKIDKPIQACLFVGENNISQNVHNVIIMEEGSEATVITGCTI